MTVRSGDAVVTTIEPARRQFAARTMTTTQSGMATLHFGQIYVSIADPTPGRRRSGAALLEAARDPHLARRLRHGARRGAVARRPAAALRRRPKVARGAGRGGGVGGCLVWRNLRSGGRAGGPFSPPAGRRFRMRGGASVRGGQSAGRPRPYPLPASGVRGKVAVRPRPPRRARQPRPRRAAGRGDEGSGARGAGPGAVGRTALHGLPEPVDRRFRRAARPRHPPLDPPPDRRGGDERRGPELSRIPLRRLHPVEAAVQTRDAASVALRPADARRGPRGRPDRPPPRAARRPRR